MLPFTLELRLVGGDSCHGLLEGRPNNMSEFRQACDLYALDNEAMVVCRQLGCIARGAQRVDPAQ